MSEYKIYTPWIKGLEHYNPSDYKSLDDFCRCIVYSVSYILRLARERKIENIEEVFFDILNGLKRNKNLYFCGKGTFASVFAIKDFSKTIKINISSLDSVNDPWLEYIKKIDTLKIKNSFLPSVDFFFIQEGVYGAICEVLKPLKELDTDIDKPLLESIRKCLNSISNQSFQDFKFEQENILLLLKTHQLKNKIEDLLYALDLIIKIKKEQNAEIDLFSPNIMVDSFNNIIINDPLSFGKYSSLKIKSPVI